MFTAANIHSVECFHSMAAIFHYHVLDKLYNIVRMTVNENVEAFQPRDFRLQ